MIDPNLPNPFRDTVVQNAWQSPADVADIHDEAFRACLAGIECASRGVSDSLLVYGAAGSGKTHLLTRVQRHLVQTQAEAPDQVLRCVFVFVRLQTAPQLLWQHVRRRLANDLMRLDQGLSQLQRLIAHQISKSTGLRPAAGIAELIRLIERDAGALSSQLATAFSGLALPRDVCLVLEHLVFGRSSRDASAWLAGESLPETALEAMGLGPDSAEDREDSARGVVTALCRLAGETLPMVFCFDQVEALQRSADDREAFFRFGQMAADLHDSDHNVFLITCLQSAVIDLFRSAVRDADLERMAKRHAVLDPLNPAQVGRLIVSRLETVKGLASLRQKHAKEPYYPLTMALVAQLSSESPCVPRRVLTACVRCFDELQHGVALPPLGLPEFLDTELFLRHQSGKGSIGPADATRLVLQGVQVLATLRAAKIDDRDPERADLVVEAERRLAFSLRNEADGRSLGPKLRALLAHSPRKDGAQLLIVRDPRLTIAKTAVRARADLATLQAQGAVLVQPTLEALAALEALQSILADAKSGDLANDGDVVREGPVLEWLRGMKTNLGLEPIQTLMDSLFGNSAGAPQSTEEQDMADLLAREHLMDLEQLSQRLGHSATVLLGLARLHSERFLVLEGPPVVVLDIAGSSAEVEV